MNWLSPELKERIRRVFEPRYKKELSNEETVVIANNLAQFVEGYARFKWNEYGKQTTR